MLTRTMAAAAATFALLVGGVLTGPAASAGDEPDPCAVGGCPGGASGENDGQRLTVKVWGSGVDAGGKTVDVPVSYTKVHPVCWLMQGPTGTGLAEWLESDAYLDSMREQAHASELSEDYKTHADDDAGHWWFPTCSSAYWEGEDTPGAETFADVVDRWFDAHPGVFVEEGETPPNDAVVSPRQLAEIALESREIPLPTIRHNPSRVGDGATFVGMPTWVWLEGTPRSLDVTAQLGTTWARVESTIAGVTLSGDGATSSGCDDLGTPWTMARADETPTCALTFFRSSANQETHTSELKAGVVWDASWVTNLDDERHDLAPQTVWATDEVPVAEIEAVVVGAQP